MRVSLNWLRDFIPIEDVNSLCETLTVSGCEIEEIISTEDDIIIEITTTPNRPDLFSIVGIAHEISNLTGKTLNIYNLPYDLSRGTLRSQNIFIKDHYIGCKQYSNTLLQGITITQSPWWLKQRLKSMICVNLC